MCDAWMRVCICRVHLAFFDEYFMRGCGVTFCGKTVTFSKESTGGNSPRGMTTMNRNQSIHQLPHIFSGWESVGVFQLFVPLYFAMSERIFQLIRQRGLSAEEQQEVVGWIASASKAEVEYKVSPKQQHLSLFIVFDLVLIASFHFIFFTHLGLE